MNAALAIPVGVVVERRKAASPWVDFTWRPVEVLAGEPVAEPWTVLSQDNDVTSFYAGSTSIELYRTETANYRDNLFADSRLWVVLRPTAAEPPYQLVRVTADPAEGEAFTEAGNDLVDTVPMPATIRQMVEAFVAEHHVERDFVKRKRNRADPGALARRPGGREDRE